MIVAQSIGFIAMLLGWWANSRRCDHQLKQANCAAALLTAVHFGLLGSPLAMTNQLVNLGRFRLSQHHSRPILALLFAAIALIQAIALANQPAEYLVTAAAIVSSIALFCCQGHWLRVGLLIATLCNFAFSVAIGSYSGIVFHFINIGLFIKVLYARPAAVADPI